MSAVDLDERIELGTDPVKARARQIRVEEDARALVRREKAQDALRLPPERASYTLDTYVAELGGEPPVMRIEDLQGERHFTVLSAQHKTGKTTLTANLACSLVDDQPFLGSFTVVPPTGRVGFFNGEMEQDDFTRYLLATKLKKMSSVAVWNLRGHGIPLMSDVGRDAAIDWLTMNNVTYWIIDPWQKVCAWSGVSENENPEVAPLVSRVQEIALEAKVENILVVHHTGWDARRPRAATALPDAADTLWHYSKDEQGIRELTAEGRGVPYITGVVALNDGQLDFTGQTRRVAKREQDVELVIEFVRNNPNVNKMTAYAEIPLGRDKSRDAVKSALDRQLLIEKKDGRALRLEVNPNPPHEAEI